ncbi:MAG: class I SAM-dependent methyltransferase [Alphaproteobacteria bacterium]|jgi:tRNA (cmo5U34)-methyltransferase|nr:class I SAM-dependent methyltransferase [Alphaproteobacteria bacterium]MBT4711866.1 class I SAM-dependent methyltransferase [Alphaproteobacteria bacterium]
MNTPSDIEPRLAQIPCLEDMIERMITTLPIDQGQAFRFLDLGGGTGTLSERFLDHFSESEGVLIEASEFQRELAQQRLDRYGDRIEFLDGDFARVDLPRDFDLLVSLGRFHQLGDIERRGIYRTAYSILRPGGLITIGDEVHGSTPRLEAMYRSVLADASPPNDDEILDLEPSSILNEGREPKGIYLNNDLAWLATVGFRDVDIFYKNLRYAVYSGRRPVASEHTFKTFR